MSCGSHHGLLVGAATYREVVVRTFPLSCGQNGDDHFQFASNRYSFSPSASCAGRKASMPSSALSVLDSAADISSMPVCMVRVSNRSLFTVWVSPVLCTLAACYFIPLPFLSSLDGGIL